MALPVCVADNQGPDAARLHFFSREGAAGDRLNGEDAKELRTHAGDSCVLSRGALHHRSFPRGVEGHRLEGRTLVVPVLEVGNRDLLGKRSGGLTCRRKIGESHNSIRIAIRKWLQKHRVHDAEDRRVGADAERHDKNGECGKAWTPAQIAAGVPEIAQ